MNQAFQMVNLKIKDYNNSRMNVYKLGDKGPAIIDIQMKLHSIGYPLGSKGVDGYFGISTKRAVLAFQKDNKLDEDGVVGGETWKNLLASTYNLGDRLLYLRSPFFKGRDVRELQKLLATLGFRVGTVDGIFGLAADRSVRELQKNLLLPADGIVGSATLNLLKTFSNIVQSHSRQPLPFKLLKPQSGFRPLAGSKINIKYHEIQGSEEASYKKLSKQITNLLKLAGAKVRLKGVYKNGDIPTAQIDENFTIGIGFSDSSVLTKQITISHPKEPVSLRFAKTASQSLQRIANEQCANSPVSAKVLNSIFIEFPEHKKVLLSSDETYFQKIAVSITDAISNELLENEGHGFKENNC
jgi:peptidoglycan hydrolase-like protein with peptidoglycan-binding domain